MYRLVEPWWWVVAIAVIVVVLDGERAATSLLVFIGVVVGLMPLAGYLYLPPRLSLLGLALGAYVSVKLAATRTFPVSVRLDGFLSVAPAVAGGTFTYWWWRDLFRGNQEDILTRLLPQWDLSTHFLFFSSVVRDGRHLAISRPQSEGFEWVGREYPAGIHYVWAQFALPLRNSSEIDTAILIPFFAHAIVLTGAVAVGVISLGFARLGRTQGACLAAGIVGAASGIALLCVGPLSTTFWGGFANVSAVAIGISMLVSFLLRPHDEIRVFSSVLVLGVWILVYNWYPTVALFVPALVWVFLRLFFSDARRYVRALILVCIIGMIPPVFFSWTLGLKHLHGSGGVNAFPQSFLLGGAAVSLALALMCFGKVRVNILLMLLTPAVLLFGLGRYLIGSVGELRYYFFKFGLFVGTYLMLLFGGLAVHFVQDVVQKSSISVPARLRYGLGVLAFSLGALWTFGYWGPQVDGLGAEAPGVTPRVELRETRSKFSDFRPLASIVIKEGAKYKTRDLRARSCALLILPKSVATDATPEEELLFGRTDPQNAIPLSNVWFRVLSDSAVTESWPYSYELIFDDQLSIPSIVSSLADNAASNDWNEEICILTTEPIIKALQRTPYEWRTLQIGT